MTWHTGDTDRGDDESNSAGKGDSGGKEDSDGEFGDNDGQGDGDGQGDSESERDSGSEADEADGDNGKQKKSILWLHAPAGAGKSAIAQSIAELCCSAKPSSLAASFFFSRNVAERNTEKYLAATLAYQIAVSIPAARPFIENVVQQDPCIFSRSLEAQFTKLIAEPLVEATVIDSLGSKCPTLILLDGLDECIGNNDGEEKQCAIIKAIYTCLTCFDISLQFLIASRPEPHIRNVFKQPDILSISHYLELDDSFDPDQDIGIFLRAEFFRIRAYHPLMASIADWPSETVLGHLVCESSQQFIYAATVIKFVGDPRHNPIQRLDMVLQPYTETQPSPFTSLDTLYRQVLDSAQPEHIDAILTLFSIALQNKKWLGPTLANIANIMGLSVQDIHLLLYDLHSIVKVSGADSQVEFFHASFPSFLESETRAGSYYISGRGRCTQVIQLVLLVVLDQQCDCAIYPMHCIHCHHGWAYRSWFSYLSDLEPTPTLLEQLEQFLVKVLKDFESRPDMCPNIWQVKTTLCAIVSVIAWLQSPLNFPCIPKSSGKKILNGFLGLFDKTCKKLIYMAIMNLAHQAGQPTCLSDILFSLSFHMACRHMQNDILFEDIQLVLVYMGQIYSSANLPTAINILKKITFSFDYLDLSSPYEKGTINLLEDFFADPSRSAEFFLGGINAQMAVWSLTSLIGDPQKYEVANQPLPPNQIGITYHLHGLFCIYHLSHASISLPLLVKFPTINPKKLRIWDGDSDSNCGGSGSDCKGSNSNCEESDLNCERSEDQLPSKAITSICKECQESGDQLNKAVTQFLLRNSKACELSLPLQKQITGKAWYFEILNFCHCFQLKDIYFPLTVVFLIYGMWTMHRYM
ncbi:hypothetical protein K443DRAFT_318427 [Laccaria amethystina LaAM-08-1]|uniref:Nephrocystin 3-like N-terminal domain-containing protein n=1 Tax=Laccaria amethystina LaAM-08-1 TaxID=1095629 RepID=A0A0C9XWI9_9AGAR|nr:hypothetical protein K443DRAFT_318427 [Laccaria amethystina LaAM-08-1]